MSSAPQSKSEAAPQPSQIAMQLSGGFIVSAAVHAVVELRVPDLLSHGALSASQLAAATGANEDRLFRVMRFLTSLGLFSDAGPRTFANTPVSDVMRSDAPNSMREMILWVSDKFHFAVYSDIAHTLRTGQPSVEHVYGKPCFDVLLSQPDVFHRFNRAMTNLSAKLAPAVLDAYDFAGVETLMDVAGGHGQTLCEILQRHPNLKGILFDTEAVINDPACEHCILNLSARCRRMPGDFFQAVPAGADAYYLQHILHDWDDEPALKILANIRQALTGVANGRVIAVDSVVPETSEPHLGKLLDLEMMLLPGGRERTDREWRDLFHRAGFELTRTIPTRASESVLEARPI